MEKAMKKTKLPRIDSIDALAKFWDTHDVTEFEGDLVEVTEPVFVRANTIRVPLAKREAKAVERLAKANGVSVGEMVRGWVLQHLPRQSPPRPIRR